MKFLRLRKLAEEINFEKDLMEAGKSKGKKDKVSEEQLEMGKEVEKEHTTNPEIAEKITRDHLEEIPDYYTHLKKMEDAVKKESAIQQPNKPKPTATLPDNMEWSWDPNAADWVAVMKNNTNVTPPLYNPQNQNLINQNTTSYMSNIKSASCLAKFLDGPRYSKEVKIEAGLIKDGLLKYAGFDFNRGAKYAITTAGLEALRRASEAEHNEAQNEREKLAYLFGFNTDKETTLDTTGHYIKGAKKFTICEADGTELGEVEALDEIDAKVKFGIEHPEYADSQSIKAICAKEVDAANKPFESTMGFYTYEVLWQDHDDKDGEFIEPIKFELCDDRDIDEWSWKCEELFGKEWFYGFLSKKDAMDKVIEELNKWGTIKGEIKQVDSLYTGRLKKLHSKYEETTDKALSYPNPSETPHTDVIIENHDGWVNTADQKRPYTEEEKRLLPLFKLLNEYVARKEITLEETPDNQPGTVATGQAEVINDLEHKVKDLGFYCEPIAEITDNDYIGADIYSLKIFYK